jgi:hypothetical protein
MKLFRLVLLSGSVLRHRTHVRVHFLFEWLSGRLGSSVRPCGRATGVEGVSVA